MTARRALITGVTGQDGSYLAELLASKGYEVFGLVRRRSRPDMLTRIRASWVPVDGDLTDQTSLDAAMKIAEPDEVYNLAAQSFVGTSWRQPILTAEVTGLGAVRVLEAARRCGKNSVRVYQASSSEMFGNAPAPQNENTPFRPRSPYGAAKAYAHSVAVNYRESYGMFVSCGILFNHESERRGPEFVTRKVTMWAASLAAGRPYLLQLGNFNTQRDWGYAPDYVDLMWRILNHHRPDDFVGATGEVRSMSDLVQMACVAAVVDLARWPRYLEAGVPELLRPAEVDVLRGDASKAAHELGWKPTVPFAEMLRRMVEADYAMVTPIPPLVAAARST